MYFAHSAKFRRGAFGISTRVAAASAATSAIQPSPSGHFSFFLFAMVRCFIVVISTAKTIVILFAL